MIFSNRKLKMFNPKAVKNFKDGNVIDRVSTPIKKSTNNYSNTKSLPIFTNGNTGNVSGVTLKDEVKKLISESNKDLSINFVTRLNDPDRISIKDWENQRNVATHKMNYATVNDKVIVYPIVQELEKGKLYDFSNKKHNKDWRKGLESALERGDYIVAPSEEVAEEYTKTYKNYYPSFDNIKLDVAKNNVDILKTLNN